ncbi:MAG: hypothetical protein IKE33_03335 [Erysipelotrichaceae bacterium]|nr:hypothetical protein [Erysipelotrichaceae bacterium]
MGKIPNFIIYLGFGVLVTMIMSYWQAYVKKRDNNGYIAILRNVYDEPYEEFSKKIDEYINNGKTSDEYKAKALIARAVSASVNDVDPLQDIRNVVITDLFYDKKHKIDKTKLRNNSDSFYWYFLILINAHLKGNKDLVELLAIKLMAYDEVLFDNLYYQIIRNYLKIIDKEEDCFEFYKGVLEGNYMGLNYDKRLIALYKRLVIAILVYNEVKLDEYDEVVLYDLAKTRVGKWLLTLFGLYDKYNREAPVLTDKVKVNDLSDITDEEVEQAFEEKESEEEPFDMGDSDIETPETISTDGGVISESIFEDEEPASKNTEENS